MNRKDKSVGRYISILYRRAQSYINSQMKEYNIGCGQHSFLIVLYDEDGISQEELSNRLMIDKGTTARAIDKLEKAGYIIRRVNPEDRRAYNVFLTEQAKAVKPILYKILSSWTDLLVGELSHEEREALYITLEKMVHSTTQQAK